ncbi:hypothetical protein [Microbispora sp. GKU 823]|uniref:hypothetical protein n=1 Tax=Microbispora sp. GKU 823 TaxID=1652100 RepID=UPI0009A3F0FF|nr:hypothetical protein [Microbispora sp. GKU 823]OPG13634.1 hypothetical protein B1L11_06510 [Microbispora sp. GKU 823]
MHEIIEWIKQSKLAFGDVVAWAALVVSLGAFVVAWRGLKWQRRAAIATEKATEAAIRSANAAEKSAALSEQAAEVPEVEVSEIRNAPRKKPAGDITWKIEHVQEAQYRLRNTGTRTATGVTADPEPFGGLARYLPENAAVRAGESLEFLLIQAWQVESPGEMWLTWDGQDEPVAVPIPPVIHF